MKNRPAHSEKQDGQLRGATAWQKNPFAGPEPIGNIIEKFASARSSQFKRACKIVEAWESLAPEATRQKSRPVGFVSGVLTVEVLSGPFLHQMQMVKNELLEKMQKQCPRSGLREIRLLPGWTSQEKDRL